MDRLNLDAETATDMKALYQEELAKAKRRIEHLQKILEQLGESVSPIDLSFSDSEKTTKAASPKRKYKKKRGPKSKWDKVIVKALKQAGKPLTYDQLTNFLMISEGRPESKRKNTRATVQNTVFRLRKENRLMTFSMGTRIKYIALKDWVENGEVKEEFKAKVGTPEKAAKPGPKGKKRGPGRPPKKRGPGRPPKKSTIGTSKKATAKTGFAKSKKKSEPEAKGKIEKESSPKKSTPAKSKKAPAKTKTPTKRKPRKAKATKSAESATKKKPATPRRVAQKKVVKK